LHHRNCQWTSTLRSTNRNRYLESHLAPLPPGEGGERAYVIQVRDITSRVLQQQKLDALHAAGSASPASTRNNSKKCPVEQRIPTLESKSPQVDS